MQKNPEINVINVLIDVNKFMKLFRKRFAFFFSLQLVILTAAYIFTSVSRMSWCLVIGLLFNLYILIALYLDIKAFKAGEEHAILKNFKAARASFLYIFYLVCILFLAMFMPLLIWLIITNAFVIETITLLASEQMGFGRIPKYVTYTIDGCGFVVSLLIIVGFVQKSSFLFLVFPKSIFATKTIKFPKKKLLELLSYHLIRLFSMIIGVMGLFFLPNMLINILLNYMGYKLEIEYVIPYLGIGCLMIMGLVVVTGVIRIIQSAFDAFDVVADKEINTVFSSNRMSISLLLVLMASFVWCWQYVVLHYLTAGNMLRGVGHSLYVLYTNPAHIMPELVGVSVIYVLVAMFWVILSSSYYFIIQASEMQNIKEVE